MKSCQVYYLRKMIIECWPLHQGNVIRYRVLLSATKCYVALRSTIQPADVRVVIFKALQLVDCCSYNVIASVSSSVCCYIYNLLHTTHMANTKGLKHAHSKPKSWTNIRATIQEPFLPTKLKEGRHSTEFKILNQYSTTSMCRTKQKPKSQVTNTRY